MKKFLGICLLFCTGAQAASLAETQKNLFALYCEVILLDSEVASIPFTKSPLPLSSVVSSESGEGLSGPECKKFFQKEEPEILQVIEGLVENAKTPKGQAEIASEKEDFITLVSDEISQLEPILYDQVMWDLAHDFRVAHTFLFPMKPTLIWETIHAVSLKVQSKMQNELAVNEKQLKNPKWTQVNAFMNGALSHWMYYAGAAFGIATVRGIIRGGRNMVPNLFSNPKFKESTIRFINFLVGRDPKNMGAKFAGGSASVGRDVTPPAGPVAGRLNLPASSSEPIPPGFSGMEAAAQEGGALVALVPKAYKTIRSRGFLDRMMQATWVASGVHAMADGIIALHEANIIKYRNDPMQYFEFIQSSIILDDLNGAVVTFNEACTKQLENSEARGLTSISLEDLAPIKEQFVRTAADSKRGFLYLQTLMPMIFKTGALKNELNVDPATAQGVIMSRFQKSLDLSSRMLELVNSEIKKKTDRAQAKEE